MKDEEINRKFEKQDESLKEYVDLKLSAIHMPKKITDRLDALEIITTPFKWMKKHPFWAIIITLVILSTLIGLSHRISIKQVIKATTGIEIIEESH